MDSDPFRETQSGYLSQNMRYAGNFTVVTAQHDFGKSFMNILPNYLNTFLLVFYVAHHCGYYMVILIWLCVQ